MTYRHLPCDKCSARCCRHIAVEIDIPDCKKDYDNIRWYLLHDNISVFIDHNDDWFIKFNSPCKHITGANSCGYYDKRPKICRNYPSGDDYCEFEGEEEYYQELFCEEEDFISYLEERDIDWQFKRL